MISSPRHEPKKLETEYAFCSYFEARLSRIQCLWHINGDGRRKATKACKTCEVGRRIKEKSIEAS